MVDLNIELLTHTGGLAFIAHRDVGAIVASGSSRFQVEEQWPRVRVYPSHCWTSANGFIIGYKGEDLATK